MLNDAHKSNLCIQHVAKDFYSCHKKYQTKDLVIYLNNILEWLLLNLEDSVMGWAHTLHVGFQVSITNTAWHLGIAGKDPEALSLNSPCILLVKTK